MIQKDILIIQIDIGPGTQWDSENSINPIRNLFMPSVKKYAQKHNYEYKLVTKSSYSDDFKFDFLSNKIKHFSFERYFHFNNNYKFTVYIDNDVYIYDHAQTLPTISGLMNAAEPEGNSSKIFREVNNLDNKKKYFNSGVTMCDAITAKKLSTYMMNRLKSYERAKGKNTDNMMLNEFILDNEDIFYELETKWNYMPFLPNSEKVEFPNFFHFVGIHGKDLINELKKRKIDLNYFINNAKFN